MNTSVGVKSQQSTLSVGDPSVTLESFGNLIPVGAQGWGVFAEFLLRHNKVYDLYNLCDHLFDRLLLCHKSIGAAISNPSQRVRRVVEMPNSASWTRWTKPPNP
jgi:hypothetical protein